MLVIPAIDLLDGQAVRLQKGSYQKVTVYNDDPLAEAQKFSEAGLKHIHIVDLDGAREGAASNRAIIQQIKEATGLSIQTGGGIRSFDEAKAQLDAGMDQVVCSSMAVKNSGDWMELLKKFPSQMILGMDLKEGEVAYGGWLETSNQSSEAFLQPMLKNGLQYVLCTDIARDGMLEGPNFALYKSLKGSYPDLQFIASGGVSNFADLQQLDEMGLYGAVVGRAYYEEIISLEQMQMLNAEGRLK